MKNIVLLIATLSVQLIYSQAEISSNILFQRKISDLLQNGINKALNNQISDSYEFFDQAYQLCLAENNSELIPVILIAQSRLYLIEEKYDEAFNNIKKAEKLISENNTTSLAGDYYEFLGQCYTHYKKYDLALDNFKIAEKIRNEIEPGKNWRTYNGMARIYKSLNKDDLYEKYSNLASKLSKIQNSRKIILDMQSELQFDEQSGTIAYLSQENLKSKVQLQKERFRNIILLMGIITLIIISSMLFFILRQGRKYNKEIATKNEIISRSLAEKETLMKEIHHRVKNNLQMISSLLSLQSRSVEDKNASEALIESQGRVISMSLIHETLYQDGPSSILDLKDYLSSLSQQIFNTYNIDGEKIKLHLDLEKIIVDVGILVPIGLIVNELITNSLKYAFKDIEKGNIFIESQLDENVLCISIQDDGIGQYNNVNEKGFGNKLIDTFAKKINASIERSYKEGTKVDILIDKSLLLHAR